MKYYSCEKKKHIGLRITFSIIALFAIFMLVINLVPPKKVIDFNPFIVKEGDKPMLCAHRGGSISNPENTMKAYKSAVEEYKADILETDLWMTNDGYLVLNHDDSINRMSDVELLTNSKDEYLISEHTLDELKNFNFGYGYVNNENNTSPYKDLVTPNQENRKEIIEENDLSIVTINELLDTFYKTNKELLFIVEIKNDGELGFKAAEILDELLTKEYPDYKDRLVVGTFHDDVEENLKNNHPTLHRGASTGGATKFIISSMLFVNLFDFDDFICLQIPLTEKGLDLTWSLYINEAHERNIAVQYWTINDEDNMKELIDKKCDAIMTDDPSLLRNVLDSYNK